MRRVVTQVKMAGKTVADDISWFSPNFHRIKNELSFTKAIILFKNLHQKKGVFVFEFGVLWSLGLKVFVFESPGTTLPIRHLTSRIHIVRFVA